MQSEDPSASPAGDTLAVVPGAGADYNAKTHLDRGDGPSSASNADSTDTNLDLQPCDTAATVDNLSENSQRGDSATVGSEEIGELLEGGFGDAERIGAELAELSAELGLLAGLADSDRLHDLFDVAMDQPGSGSSRSSSSSTWSGAHGARARAHARPARPTRRRTIAKMKEGLRRRTAGGGARRAGEAPRWRAGDADAASDVSDVGADSDSDDDWWTECSSESSSVKEPAAPGGEFDCGAYENKPQEAEAPPMGAFLLPLFSPGEASAAPPPSDHFLIRHEDILQLLASAEESARGDAAEGAPPADDTLLAWGRLDAAAEAAAGSNDVTPEEEAAVLRYVCEAEQQLSEGEGAELCAVEEWLLGIYHSWCEISVLMYTMLGAASAGIDYENWLYRAHFTCHCRLCVCRASNSAWLARHIDRIVISLARGEETMRDALTLMRALNLQQPGAALQPHTWDISPQLHISEQGAAVIEHYVERLNSESDLTRELLERGCLCRPREKQHQLMAPVEGFIDVLDRFKTSFYTAFRVEMLSCDGGHDARLEAASRRLALHLQSYQRSSVSARLADLTANMQLKPGRPGDSQCECREPRTFCPQQRKQLLRLSFYSLRQVVGQLTGPRVCPELGDDKPPCETELVGTSRELLQSPEICPKPPDSGAERENGVENATRAEKTAEEEAILTDVVDDWEEGSGSGSLGAAPSPLDSASQLLLAAAAAVESAGDADPPGELCRTVRHLMRSIASIEVLMDRVLKHCSGVWPPTEPDRCSAQLELLEVDRKLMAMYRRLPEVHQKQLQVYRKQKKLSTVCTQLVGGSAPPPPPPPGSPPPAASPRRAAAVCPEYHLRRFKEVKRKVLHMRDQQLYYHRLRLWLEEQLRRDKPDGGGEAEGAARAKRATSPRLRAAAARRRSRALAAPADRDAPRPPDGADPPPEAAREAEAGGAAAGGGAAGAEQPAADAPSDTDTIVDKGEELCSEVKECAARFAEFALDAPDLNLNAVRAAGGPPALHTLSAQPAISAPPPANLEIKNMSQYPDSLSPPLQDMSPTCTESLPVYRASHKSINKLLNRSAHMLDRLKEDYSDYHNGPQCATDMLTFAGEPNTRRLSLASMLMEHIKLPERPKLEFDDVDVIEIMGDDEVEAVENQPDAVEDSEAKTEDDYEATAQALLAQFGDFKLTPAETAAVKNPLAHKYVTFGLEIKRAIEECKNIINHSCYMRKLEDAEFAKLQFRPKDIPGLEKTLEAQSDNKDDGILSIEQIYEAIMSIDNKAPDILGCIDKNVESSNEPIDFKIAEFVENMPQILANIPEIATKLSEFPNFQFELPEFAKIINNLPEVNNEAQLTPETLKQIRELKISKARDSVKVTKHTSKRKSNRRLRSNVDNDIIGTITLDIDKEMNDLIREEKEARSKNKNSSKEDHKDLLFSISAQVVTNKVCEYVKQSMNPDVSKCIEDEFKVMYDVLMVDGQKSEVCTKASTLFDNSVKDALSMQELRDLVESRFNSWKQYVNAKFKNIPMEILEEEIENMLGKFYGYIQDLAEKQSQNDSDKIPEKLEIEDKIETKDDSAKHKDDPSTELEAVECPKHDDKANPCDCIENNKPSEIESLKQIMKFIKDSVGSTFDIIIMQTSKMSKEHKNSVKNLKFKYMDVIRRCAESGELASWILLDPEVAANVILEMTGLAPKKTGDSPDFSGYTNEKKLEYFMQQLREMNRIYVRSLSKSSYTGDEWLVVLYRLEQLETKLKEALSKAAHSNMKPAQTQTQSNVSETREAERLAGKGLSKIINQANKSKKPATTTANNSEVPSPKTDTPPKIPPRPPVVPDKAPQPPLATDVFLGYQLYKQSTNANNTAPINVEPPKVEVRVCQETQTERRAFEKNDALLAKCEAILTARGEKSLLDSFYTIKSYITSGLPVPESYKKHVIRICSSIDAKLLDGEPEDNLSKSKTIVVDVKSPKPQPDKPKAHEHLADPNLKPTDKCAKPSDCTRVDKSGKPPQSCAKRIMKCCENSDEVDSGASSPRTCCPTTKGGKHFAIIGSQNPELLAKYSAQALRNVKQSLNAVAFNSIRNGSKTKEDLSDTNAPKSDCKWTNDCICTSCRGSDGNNICLGDIVKQCVGTNIEKKVKSTLESCKPVVGGKPPVAKDAKAPVSAQPKGQPVKAPAKPAPPKLCENVHPSGHQPHVCKMGHTQAASAGCANEANHHQNGVSGPDQPCNCCYCTVFGHAPPMTTPVPRNFNETRERLRSILNRKKQQSRTLAGAEPESQENKKTPATTQPAPETVQPPVQPALRPAQPAQKPSQPALKPAQPVAVQRPPAVKAVPAGTARKEPTQGHNYLAEQMAKMILSSDGQEGKETLAGAPPAKAAPVKAETAPAAAAARAPRSPPHAPHSPPYPPRPLSQEEQVLEQELLLQYQQMQQKQLQKAMLQKQPAAAAARQPRAAQREQSFSSRDTSVFSTSSGCSGESGWRDGCVSDDCERVEDTRDLDALLQYIEGPARHVDRGKKRAKKQRQKAKKMECKLAEEREELAGLAALQRRLVESLRAEQAAARRCLDESRAAVKQTQQAKRKGKKGKTCPSQQGAAQLAAERHGACNMLFTQTSQALREAETELTDVSSRLAACEAELRESQALQAASRRAAPTPAASVPQPPIYRHADDSNMVRVRRSPGDGAVTVSAAGRQRDAPLASLLHTNASVTVLSAQPPAEGAKEAPKKQSWEAALAHINALATRAPARAKEKEKEKEKVKKASPREAAGAGAGGGRSGDSSRSQSLTEQPLSKKQRRLLARQQAEEEEARRRLQEAKAKKTEAAKKTDGRKTEPSAKVEPARKEPAGKKAEAAGRKKEEPKKTESKEKPDKGKGKENKANNASAGRQEKAAAPAGGKAQKGKPQLINITADTTIQLLNNKGGCGADESPSACSIMEQLSCGVQVADLRLPPGITLTRVPHAQPAAPAIKSVPLWKCGSLAAAPTPPQRAQPIINADPGLHSHSILEPPKAIVIQETPHPVGKSKKAKKKAKKAAAASAALQTKPNSGLGGDAKKTDGTKMVTLRNPMFHPNLPPVQVTNQANHNKKVPEQIRIPDPIPMPPNACQATITPTSNGMYTIRNPLMSMVHQQSMMGMAPQNPNQNPHLATQSAPSFPNAYVVNPNHFNSMPPPASQHAQYAMEPQISPQIERKHFVEERQPPAEYRRNEYVSPSPSARVLNLASFTQKNDEGYSLFKPSHEESNGRTSAHFPEAQPGYAYAESSAFRAPNPIVSPNPIGTRPEPVRSFESNDSSFFTNKMPEPIGTPMTKREDFVPGLYTPFGQAEERDFRPALFQRERAEGGGARGDGARGVPNGDTLPYFQRLRVGARLNNEVTIHHVTESKFFKTGSEHMQHAPLEPPELSSAVFGARPPYAAKTWTSTFPPAAPAPAPPSSDAAHAQFAPTYPFKNPSGASSVYDSVSNSSSNSPQTNDAYHRGEALEEYGEKEEGGYGAIGRAAPIGSQRMMNGLRGPNSFYPV